ncbi:MAG: cytochrome c biogenesis protein ResB [Planctomycetes bacterium]|nr:cytochrome c biogenesis protein ResB [Planctomycetota bacterium]MCB9829890.1 cytochrome c biogenesis protein ResB [Planctomycetota bacterium]MCB9901961.1 cytochrome c biogenesis protein ResB [Planctomycetota bacterium]
MTSSSSPPKAPTTSPLAPAASAQAGAGLMAWPARIGRGLLALFSSYLLAVVVLLLLLLLTYLGTLAQQSDNLYNVQQRYFDSLFFVEDLGGLPVPLPGAYLLLAILFVNLVVGGLARMKYTWSRAGIVVTHVGMAVLLVGSFVEFQVSTKGYLALYEQEEFQDVNENGVWDPGEPFDDVDGNGQWTPGEAGSMYLSHYDWDLTLTPARSGRRTQVVLPFDELVRAADGPVRFEGGGLPFPVEVWGWAPNARVERTPPRATYGVDGLVLRAVPEHPEKKEHNRPGCYVRLYPPGSAPIELIAWSAAQVPFRAQTADGGWDVALDKRGWVLPFQVRLDRFVRRMYPGTNMPKEYSSHITKIEHDVPEGRHITMNEPLRHKGYILYQSSYSTETLPKTGRERNISVFAVVENPADRIPWFAVGLIFLGLLYHFGFRLVRYLGAEARRRHA